MKYLIHGKHTDRNLVCVVVECSSLEDAYQLLLAAVRSGRWFHLKIRTSSEVSNDNA